MNLVMLCTLSCPGQSSNILPVRLCTLPWCPPDSQSIDSHGCRGITQQSHTLHKSALQTWMIYPLRTNPGLQAVSESHYRALQMQAQEGQWI